MPAMCVLVCRNNKVGSIGFLKMQNRINVMLSRAQWGMYVLGNKATLIANAESAPMWSKVRKKAAGMPLRLSRNEACS